MKKLTTEEFIIKAKSIHGDRYDYSLVKYNGYDSIIKIKCKKHGIFEQEVSNHLQGKGCEKCKYDKLSNCFIGNKEDFIEKSKKFHGDRYDYSLVNYINNREKVKIICKKHGEFLQKPNNHLDGKQGCPKCKNSIGETKVENWLKTNNFEYIPQKRFKDCIDKRSLVFDFYIPKNNICIEFDGIQHFKPLNHFGKKKFSIKQSIDLFKDRKRKDCIKDKYCIENDINLIRISYKDKIEERLEEELCQV